MGSYGGRLFSNREHESLDKAAESCKDRLMTNRTRAIRTLRRLYASTDADTRAMGRTWYAEAQAEARRLAREAAPGIGMVRAAAILAVTSPGTRWGQNVKVAREAIAAHANGATAADAARVAIANGSYPANARKVGMLLLGAHPASVVSGPKVTQFFRAICGDPAAMTLDRWAIRAAGFSDDPWPSVRLRRELCRAYERAAELSGESARDFQAITWLAIRGIVPSDAITRMPA